MHIINAFLRLTSLSVGRVRSCFGGSSSTSADELSPPQRTTAFSGNNNASASEQTPLLLSQAPSLTGEYTDFAHSWGALHTCLLHATIYYGLAVFGFCYLVEHWTVIDALYLATVIFCTIGFGDLTPSDSAAARVYTMALAFYGIIILGLFLGVAGQAVVDAHNRAMERNRAIIRFKVLDTLSKKNAGLLEDDETMVEMVDEDNNNNNGAGAAPSPPLQREASSTVSSLFHEQIISASSSQPGLWQEICSIVFLEAPVILIVIVFAIIVGRVEGWSWDESVYYAAITGTTIGFGDYAPQHEGVRLASCFLLPLMVAVLGECLARIASAYMDRKSRQAEERFFERSFTLSDLKTMDTNKNGVVEKGEFLAYMLVALQKVEKEEVDQIHELFHKLDVSRTGVLSTRDIYVEDWNDIFRSNFEDPSLKSTTSPSNMPPAFRTSGV